MEGYDVSLGGNIGKAHKLALRTRLGKRRVAAKHPQAGTLKVGSNERAYMPYAHYSDSESRTEHIKSKQAVMNILAH
jgi:hypothetical protein